MHTYQLTDAMTFRSGRFLLSAEQLSRRIHLVRVIEGNLVEPIFEIGFKRGELVQTDHVLPKALEHKAQVVEPALSQQPQVQTPSDPTQPPQIPEEPVDVPEPSDKKASGRKRG